MSHPWLYSYSVVGVPVPSAFIYRFRLFAARAKQAEKAYEQYRAQLFGRHDSIP